MVTGSIKNKVDRIWETFWTGGITNPIQVIEQITYLLFIRRLDEIEKRKASEALVLGIPHVTIYPEDKQNCKWDIFKDKDAASIYQIVRDEVFPFIKELHPDEDSAYSIYMKDAIFMIPTPQVLTKVVDGIDQLPMDNRDESGDLYEYLLSKLSTSGTNGQFRTPRHIIDMMVELMKPLPEDIICDPATGTAGFLVSAGEYFRDNYEEKWHDAKFTTHFNNDMFYGHDMDRTMLRIGAMNMMLHGVDNPNIEYRDSLSIQNTDKNKYTLVLTNPPFKGSLDYDTVSEDLLSIAKTKKTELLFLSLILRMLKKGGRCASIVPDGVLFGSTKAHKAVRREIIENHRLEAVISMPSGVFKPYAGVSTAILVFTKTDAGGTDNVWFYDMQSDGYSLDDKRTELETKGDIPDIIKRFHNRDKEAERVRTDQSFLVPIKNIRENEYDLSLNRYKEIVYEAIEYDPPKEILGQVKELEKQIMHGIEELEDMVK